MVEKLVLAGPASEDLGRAVAEKLGLGLLKAEFKVFPDGETKFTVNEKVSGKSVKLLMHLAMERAGVKVPEAGTRPETRP